ncbi:GNAT family N-acetyltransferase [Kineococcus sp. SYSU DK005]|uniref:GNAT family N-acetyltransferase n=1 Tax=Kineococcus sp. SYSU DK005 TaxID=3383126 RepID=UPI003D7D3575
MPGPSEPTPAPTTAPATAPVPVRRATARDAPALVRLRVLMLQDMGVDTGGPEAPWRADAERFFHRRLAEPALFAAFVADDPELGVVSCAVGACDEHAPSPRNTSGLHGHVSNVATDPRRRRRGLARACTTALLGWFTDHTPVTVVKLNTTARAEALYRSMGFEVPRDAALQLRLPPRPA